LWETGRAAQPMDPRIAISLVAMFLTLPYRPSPRSCISSVVRNRRPPHRALAPIGRSEGIEVREARV